MADIIYSEKDQSMDEVREWGIDFTLDIPSGVSISEVLSVSHIPPEGGTATTPVIGTLAGGIVPLRLGPVDKVGIHELITKVLLSNDEKISLKLVITVVY